MNIHAKLSEIQQNLKAPKSQKNLFGKYQYRSCEDILEAVKPLLGDTSLTLHDDLIVQGDRFYIKATAILHLERYSVSCSALAREPANKKGMDESQITGAASSYARKYALNGLFCIDDTKDADTTNEHNVSEPEVINKKQTKELEELLERVEKDKVEWCGLMGIPAINKLPVAKFKKVISRLEEIQTKKLQEVENANN